MMTVTVGDAKIRFELFVVVALNKSSVALDFYVEQ